MNKKSIGALLLSAALLVGGTASTFAYFTNSASTGVVTFTTGNVKIEFDKAKETSWELLTENVVNPNDKISISEDGQAVTNVAPGDSLIKSFELKNTGTLNAKVRLSVISETGQALPEADESNVEWKAYKVTSDGTEVPVQIKYETAAEDKDYAVLPANTNETLRVEAIVKVSETLGNASADKTFKFAVKAEATQVNNPGWTENGL